LHPFLELERKVFEAQHDRAQAAAELADKQADRGFAGSNARRQEVTVSDDVETPP
jgi:hypothetical protein